MARCDGEAPGGEAVVSRGSARPGIWGTRRAGRASRDLDLERRGGELERLDEASHVSCDLVLEPRGSELRHLEDASCGKCFT